MSRSIAITTLILAALVAGLLLLSSGRQRSGQDQTEEMVNGIQGLHSGTSSSGLPVSNLNVITTTPPSPPVITNQEPKRLATLERDYEDTDDFGIRLSLMNQIGDFKEAAAVETLTRLFVIEADESLKIELLDVINTFEEHTTERLAMLAFAIEPAQPVAVREAAIDVLITVEDARAVTLLEFLLKDADEDVREAANSGLTLLREVLATQ